MVSLIDVNMKETKKMEMKISGDKSYLVVKVISWYKLLTFITW